MKVELICGERGIQTPGTLQYGGFQDRCNRSLCHLSSDTSFFQRRCKDKAFSETTKQGNRFSFTIFLFTIYNCIT
jgi:hypothetical protein